MSPLDETIFDLKSDCVCEVLDLAQVHLQWTARHLQEGRHEKALASFQQLVAGVRAAATEMTAIRGIIDNKKLTAEAAIEARAVNQMSAKLRPAQKRPETA